jgi:hypothetical protein
MRDEFDFRGGLLCSNVNFLRFVKITALNNGTARKTTIVSYYFRTIVGKNSSKIVWKVLIMDLSAAEKIEV